MVPSSIEATFCTHHETMNYIVCRRTTLKNPKPHDIHGKFNQMSLKFYEKKKESQITISVGLP